MPSLQQQPLRQTLLHDDVDGRGPSANFVKGPVQVVRANPVEPLGHDSNPGDLVEGQKAQHVAERHIR